jgi:multidrug efflux pump subunit AcrB
MDALYEAIGLVVIVSLIGFWEWRSALLMALSIPITLCLTFGMIYLLGIDIQQVSVASLIIALGLLVDDPVVAGESIKRMLAEGQSRIVTPWLGPTKIATAILYATITNLVAYLPFLLVTGNTGEFLYSLPIVMTCALVASRLASMTFKPVLAFAAAPYGVAGALIALWIMNTSFGFMAFLGIASLIGVMVSRVIVLFDFIEEMHAQGELFEQAVIDADIIRLRPVLITVGATVLALFPLAIHGGPLWQPLCYAQISGLTVATSITLLMVPVLYSLMVLDRKWLTWDASEEEPTTAPAAGHPIADGA